MAYAGVLEDIRRCIALQVPSRVPYFPISVMFDYHHFGYSLRALAQRAGGHGRAGRAGGAEFDYDVYMLHPDDLLEYEGLGIGIQAEEDLPAAVCRIPAGHGGARCARCACRRTWAGPGGWRGTWRGWPR